MVNGRARSIGLPKWSFRIAVYTRWRWLYKGMRSRVRNIEHATCRGQFNADDSHNEWWLPLATLRRNL